MSYDIGRYDTTAKYDREPYVTKDFNAKYDTEVKLYKDFNSKYATGNILFKDFNTKYATALTVCQTFNVKYDTEQIICKNFNARYDTKLWQLQKTTIIQWKPGVNITNARVEYEGIPTDNSDWQFRLSNDNENTWETFTPSVNETFTSVGSISTGMIIGLKDSGNKLTKYKVYFNEEI